MPSLVLFLVVFAALAEAHTVSKLPVTWEFQKQASIGECEVYTVNFVEPGSDPAVHPYTRRIERKDGFSSPKSLDTPKCGKHPDRDDLQRKTVNEYDGAGKCSGTKRPLYLPTEANLEDTGKLLDQFYSPLSPAHDNDKQNNKRVINFWECQFSDRRCVTCLLRHLLFGASFLLSDPGRWNVNVLLDRSFD